MSTFAMGFCTAAALSVAILAYLAWTAKTDGRDEDFTRTHST